MVWEERSRSPLEKDPWSVCHLDFWDHAPADPGGNSYSLLPKISEVLPYGSPLGEIRSVESLKDLGRAGILFEGKESPPSLENCPQSFQRKNSWSSDRSSQPSRNREIYRRRHSLHRLQQRSTGSGWKREESSITTLRRFKESGRRQDWRSSLEDLRIPHSKRSFKLLQPSDHGSWCHDLYP